MKPRNWISAALTAIAVAILPGCDTALQQIKPGITTASEVRAKMGSPGFEFRNEDGNVTWEYTRQPAGVHCYMISFDRNQIVRSVDQVLNAKNYARIRDGMSGDEIRRLLGAPATKVVFDNLGEDIWEWHIEGTPPMEETYFMVHFDLGTGKVRKTSQRVAMKN
ncbi:MAG: outer membrane protein assembly factor BamE [Azonexus sp.]